MLKLCAPKNRALHPGKVWLCLIPLFGVVWFFVLVNRIAESLRSEFESRHLPAEGFGRSIGLAYGILALASIAPYLNLLTGPAGFVCWIIYWVKIAAYSRRLAQTGPFPEGGLAEESPAAEGPFDLRQAWLMLFILMFALAGQTLQNLGLSWVMPAVRGQFGWGLGQTNLIYLAYIWGLISGYAVMTVVTALAGSRWGLAVALGGASLSAAAGGVVTGGGGMVAARALLGFFAGGLLPAAIQSIREFFTGPMRPLAIGFVLASNSLATLLMSPFGPHLAAALGWRTVLMITGVLTALAAALSWFMGRPPLRGGGSGEVSSLAALSVVMLGIGLLLACPLYRFAQSFLPIYIGRELGAMGTTLSTINSAALAGGSILGGIAALAMMRAGASPWKARAALLTLFGLILASAALAGISARGWALVFVSGVVLGAFGGWSTLLYAGVADTLPPGGVGVGTAIGALMTALPTILFNPALVSLTSERGPGFTLGVSGVMAAGGLLCVVSLAWFRRPGMVLPSPASPEVS